MRIIIDYAHYLCYSSFMQRLNLSIPDEVYELSLKWRDRVNLSEIASRALRAELQALDSHRSIHELMGSLRSPTPLERQIGDRHNLIDVVVCDSSKNEAKQREILGQAAANYLGHHLCDGSILGIAGGRQMWCLVRNLSPRNLSLTITALGVGQHDPKVLHAHASTLTTLLWLLFSPRSEAHLVGADAFSTIWSSNLPAIQFPRYFIVGSCGPFERESPLASVLGNDATTWLLNKHACGDYLYQFFDHRGRLIEPPKTTQQSLLPQNVLKRLASRADARVVLVAGGKNKEKFIRYSIRSGLCNVLITDFATAQILHKSRRSYEH